MLSWDSGSHWLQGLGEQHPLSLQRAGLPAVDKAVNIPETEMTFTCNGFLCEMNRVRSPPTTTTKRKRKGILF